MSFADDRNPGKERYPRSFICPAMAVIDSDVNGKTALSVPNQRSWKAVQVRQLESRTRAVLDQTMSRSRLLRMPSRSRCASGSDGKVPRAVKEVVGARSLPLGAALERDGAAVPEGCAGSVRGVNMSRTDTGCGVPKGFLALARGFLCGRVPKPEQSQR